MMTLQDILGVISTLPNEDLDQLEYYILKTKKQRQITDSSLDEEWALSQIREILKDVPPTPITYGTMDGDKFLAVMREMHNELSENDRREIIHAMNEEYIPEDKS